MGKKIDISSRLTQPVRTRPVALPSVEDVKRVGNKKPGRPRSDDPRTVTAVGLKKSELEKLAGYAAGYGITPHSLLAYLVRQGLEGLESGKIKIETTTRAVIKS